MNQAQINYKRIEQAIHFIRMNFKAQPSLETIAEAVHVSPFHFQKMFKEWVGVSPKKFMQYISLEHAKKLLRKSKPLMDAAYETGLSGSGRLHDLFVKMEGVTPGEFKNGGAALTIQYNFAESPFGRMMVASTHKGVCHMHFLEDKEEALIRLKASFPNARFRKNTDKLQQDAVRIFQKNWKNLDEIKLHLAGTPFQLKVWESLLKIPMGALVSYGDIARNIGSPKSFRAVGTAVGRNPITYLIPCHRVIQSGGKMGGYGGGLDKKTALIGWEAARTDTEHGSL